MGWEERNRTPRQMAYGRRASNGTPMVVWKAALVRGVVNGGTALLQQLVVMLYAGVARLGPNVVAQEERLKDNTVRPESVFADGTGDYCLEVTRCYSLLKAHVSPANGPLYLQLQREKELGVTTFAGALLGTAA